MLQSSRPHYYGDSDPMRCLTQDLCFWFRLHTAVALPRRLAYESQATSVALTLLSIIAALNTLRYY